MKFAGRKAEDLPIPQPPYIKGKGFCPNPVVVNGIPDYADGIKNPKFIGTPEYEQYWQEQLYRCINGYNTGGIFLPGMFYYYMNFNSMATVNGVISPDFCDMHLQLCYIAEFCKANNLNLVVPKKRRAGVSEFFQKRVDHGYRFLPAYHAGIAAGKKTYADDFVKKLDISESLLVPEFKVNNLTKNSDEITSGYEVLEQGKTVKKGLKTEIYIRTAHNNPNIFKGTYLNEVICEEAGEFDEFKLFYNATKDCLTDSGLQVGVMYIFGTGGNINKGSRDFKFVCENLKDFNAVIFTITGDRFKKPYYGGATRNGKVIGVTPNLSKIYKPYQLIGCEDREAALKDILEEREILKKGELKAYLEHLQNNPISQSEIFMRMFSNKFNIQKLNAQAEKIAVNPNKYSKYKLEWVTDDKGALVYPRKVKAVPIKDGSYEDECVLILDGYHPTNTHQHLYCAGIDPYDQDEAKSSKSLGAMAVLIRKNTTQGSLQMAPVATICCRPKRKEIFFDMCLKLAVYYDLKHNVLGDKAGSSGIIQWFKDAGCAIYLANRPQKFEAENTTQTHEYWVSLNKTSRPMMVGIMQSWIEDWIDSVWFDEVILQLGNFDEVEEGSDNDLADAIGIALMQDVSMAISARENTITNEKNPFVLGGWKYNSKGILVPENDFERPINPEKDFSGFGR